MNRQFPASAWRESARTKAWLLIGALLVACAAIYAPGLWGAFVLDDLTFIVGNTALHIQTLHLADLVSAALSFPAGSHQGRWLTMLSFAVNHFFTGLDPFYLKLTNLGIHLVNGVLVFLMLRALFALYRECRSDIADRTTFDPSLCAATIAGLWLVLPINLTAVLYVTQRLESLSNTFVFIGLWWYLRARLSLWSKGSGTLGLCLSLVTLTFIGALAKESAIMLPLYAACVEFAITGFRGKDGRWSRPVLSMYAVMLGVPLIVGLVWLGTWVGGDSSYARPFDTIERLMTEARVVVDYIHWTLIPNADSLTLFHDDIAVSHGIFDPPTTALAIASLAGLFGAACWLRFKLPLFTLGVLWFFAGHLLTGTVIPLMLAFEHRNYFPSLGLLLAGASLITLESGLQRSRMRLTLAACAFLFYSFTTWMRAEEWSDPLRLALAESNKRPDSSAAQYELGRVLLASTRKSDDAPMVDQAFEVFERASHIPNSDILHEQILIVGHAQLGRPIDPAWWDSLIAKLRSRPPTSTDIGGLVQLFWCQEQRVCPQETERLKDAFEAAVSYPSADRALLTIYAAFVDKFLHDSVLAEKQYRAALALAPSDPTTHINLTAFLIHHGQLDAARTELEAFERLNYLGSQDKKIDELKAMLRQAESADTSNSTLKPADAK